MTKSLRWGIASVLTLAGLAMVSVVGCSDDTTGTPPPEDTGTPDTGSADTGSDTGSPTDSATDSPTDTPTDTPPFVADRAVSIVHASPDFGAKLFCLGAFTGDPAAATAPLQTLGPIGRPDATAPTDPAKFTAIPYGAVVPIPLSAIAVGALKAFTVAIWAVDTNPLAGGKKCEDTWATAKAGAVGVDWLKVDKDGVKAGESGLIAIKGCLAASTADTPGCGPAGAAKSLKWELHKLDTVKPTTFAGGGTGAKTGIQFLHFSKFASIDTTAGMDFYLQGWGPVGVGDAGTDAGDAADGGTTIAPAGEPVLVAAGAKYGDVAPKSVGVQLAGDLTLSRLHFFPKDTPLANVKAAIAGGVSAGVPLKDFLAGYAAVGGGFIDGQNQFVAAFGAPPIPTGDAGTTTNTLRIAFGRADF